MVARFLAVITLAAAPAAAFVPSSAIRSTVASSPLRSTLRPQQSTAHLPAAHLPRTRCAAAARELDTDALVKYGSAIGIQMAGLTAFLGALDQAAALAGVDQVPFAARFAVFLVLALKTRAFNPLNNRRPDLEKAVSGEATRGFNDRVMPSWTPPGVTFPIMWVLIVAPLRAYASTLVLAAHGGAFLDPAVLALMLHLSIGDTWNTINNAERRLGAAVPGVFCVWLSVINAARVYGEADPTAGLCLAATSVWITVAGLLIFDTYRVNNADGDEPLYPYVGQASTKFAWSLPF